MGGGIALQYVLRAPHQYAACFALSSFMCSSAKVYEQPTLRAPPIFMRHGGADGFIRPEWGTATADRLMTFGVSVDYDIIPGLPHALADSEIEELTDWLLPKLSAEGAGLLVMGQPGQRKDDEQVQDLRELR